jgi:phage shock protein PspC (stress-responsive transcriptional regulator)
MRRVITVSLNGNAFQLEEDACTALGAYLEQAGRALAGNPDRTEILADLEQAIADKCSRYLSPHKSVLSQTEIATVLAEMGPVEAEPGADAAPGAAPGATPAGSAPQDAPRRLYQISAGAKLSGVCNGLAAYFGLDVTLVRLVFVLLALLSAGTMILVYLVLMFVVPYAETDEERAAAHGVPFNARTLVESAKRSAAGFAAHRDWRRSRAAWRAEWRRTKAEWRAEWRRARDEWRAGRYGPPPAAPAPRAPYAAHVVTGLLAAIASVVLVVLTVGWVVALLSLIFTGAILGWVLPFALPFWLVIVLLVLVFQLVALPLRAIRRAAYHYDYRYHAPWVGAWDGMMTLAVLALVLWYAYHHVGGFHDFVDHVRGFWPYTDSV